MTTWQQVAANAQSLSDTYRLVAIIARTMEVSVTTPNTPQQDIDAATAEFTTLLGDVTDDTTQLVTDLINLKAAIATGAPISTQALDAVVARAQGVDTALKAAVGNVTDLAPGSTTTTTPPTSSTGTTTPTSSATTTS